MFEGRSAGPATERDRVLLRPRRRGGRERWDADEIADYLMSIRRRLLRALARRTPWAGLDAETLESCYSHGAAVVVRLAVSGGRVEWRGAKDLERAQIAAFRHQALDHWKRVNAESRRGDRDSVAFDPNLHSPEASPIERLFEQPDLHVVQRDLLAELDDLQLKRFWSAILNDSATFKEAGDALGLTKREVAASTRVGRTRFAGYLDRREAGELCRDRARDIARVKAGTCDADQRERAEAHLQCCYACALVFEPETSAIQRGILGVAPTGFLLRLLMRATDIASSPVARVADSGSAARAIAVGAAAVAVGAGVERVGSHPDVQTPGGPHSSIATKAQSNRALPQRVFERARSEQRQVSPLTQLSADRKARGQVKRIPHSAGAASVVTKAPPANPKTNSLASNAAAKEFVPEVGSGTSSSPPRSGQPASASALTSRESAPQEFSTP